MTNEDCQVQLKTVWTLEIFDFGITFIDISFMIKVALQFIELHYQ